MLLHLGALQAIHVTASQHGPRGVASHPELGHYKPNCKERPTFYFVVYSILGITAGAQLIHPINSIVLS
jgi:hypothetical protein